MKRKQEQGSMQFARWSSGVGPFEEWLEATFPIGIRLKEVKKGARGADVSKLEYKEVKPIAENLLRK